jgi:hypothetical protein
VLRKKRRPSRPASFNDDALGREPSSDAHAPARSNGSKVVHRLGDQHRIGRVEEDPQASGPRFLRDVAVPEIEA